MEDWLLKTKQALATISASPMTPAETEKARELSDGGRDPQYIANLISDLRHFGERILEIEKQIGRLTEDERSQAWRSYRSDRSFHSGDYAKLIILLRR